MSREENLARALERTLPFRARVGHECAEAGCTSEAHEYELPTTWAEKRRREFLAGRKAAREALLGWSAPPEVLRDGDGVPLFPPGFSGSITHTGARRTRAFSIVIEAPRRIGLDAEEVRRLDSGVQAHIVDGDEFGALRLGPLEIELGVLAAFSAKEAFYKCVFPEQRRFIGFREVRFEYVERRADSETRLFDCVLEHKSQNVRLPGVVLVTPDLVLSSVWSGVESTNS
jgi:4'-phosphopantetheinyl transferase EntD